MESVLSACVTIEAWRAGTHQALGQRIASCEASNKPPDCGIVPLERSAVFDIARWGNNNGGNHVKKIFALAAITMLSTAPALAQSGANPSAPQMNSTGTGVTQPGVDARGTAIDRPTGTTGMAPVATGSERGNNASSLNGSNAASGTYSGANAPSNTDAGRTSGGGGGGGSGSGGN